MSSIIITLKLLNIKKVCLNILKFSSARMNYEEVTIPVPWGHISGKWWGNKKLTPVVAIHDLRQNAGAFDKVIPKLNFPSVLAIDLPGHGKSTNFPKGRIIVQIDFLIALRYMSRALPVGQLTFLGHGFGSYISFLYAASYCKLIEAVISVECSRHALLQLNMTRINWFGEMSDRFTEIEKTEKMHQTEQDILNFYKSTSGQMSEEAARILAERGSYIAKGMRYLSIDPRYEMNIILSFTDEDFMIALNNVKAKVAVIRNVIEDELPELTAEQAARKGVFDENNHLLIRRKGPDIIRKLNEKSLISLRESCRMLLVQEYRALNHILLDNADLMASAINTFAATNTETSEIFRSNSNKCTV